MRQITINTRTLPPTNTEPKRVRVRTSEGVEADYPWDHSHDAPEVHENAARQAAVMGDPAAPVTLHRTGSGPMGYTFRALIGS